MGPYSPHRHEKRSGVATTRWRQVRRPPPPVEAYTGLTMGLRLLMLAVVVLFWTLPLEAQQTVELEFNAGRVTLNAQNASARVILSEWARLGDATIVNGDDVVGPRDDDRIGRHAGTTGARHHPAGLGRLCTRATPRRCGRRIGVRPCRHPGYQCGPKESPPRAGRDCCPDTDLAAAAGNRAAATCES